MRKILILLDVALQACAPAAINFPVNITRENEFTGRGNRCETLLTAELELSQAMTLKNVQVRLNAGKGDVTAVRLLIDGREADCRTASETIRFRLKENVQGCVTLSVCADIAEGAKEGNTVTADIVSIGTEDGICTPPPPDAGGREILLVRSLVVKPGDYGSKNYRIPAICTLADGSLLAATDKRKFNNGDLPSDIDIIVQRSTDGGRTWSDPVTVVEGQGYGKGYGDANLVVASDGTVVCTFSGGAGLWGSTPDNPQTLWVCTSSDNGQSWSEPVDLTAMQWGPNAKNPECRDYKSAFFGSGHGLLLTRGEHAGRLMVVTGIANRENRIDNYAVWSDDNGRTWDISTLAYRGGDEAKVVELTDGRILMSVRQNGMRGWNISEDGGRTWGEQQRWEDMVTTACDGDIIRAADTLLLQSLPNCLNRRENVSIFISSDEGKTWPAVRTICPGRSMYSSLTILPDGTIGAYVEEQHTDQECDMWFLNFSVNWLLGK